MLKKIEYYYDRENHEKIDIEDEKIYWDTNMNQFRHKFECCECGKPMGCRCYDELYEARVGVEEGIICGNCGFQGVIEEDTVLDLLDLLDAERKHKISQHIISLLTEKEKLSILENILVDKNTGFTIRDILEDIYWEDERDGIIRTAIIDMLTYEERADHFNDNCDEWASGERCGI